MEFKNDPDIDEYKINNHGIIGDTFSAALITIKGTIDWCTFPRMDSPPVMSSLLDKEKGGEFRIELSDAIAFSQKYRKHTNILETRIRSEKCELNITDFMPVEEVAGLIYARHEIHRIITCTRGSGVVRISLSPRFNFGREKATLHAKAKGCIAQSDGDSLTLLTKFKMQIREGDAHRTFNIRAGNVIPIVLRWNGREPREPRIGWVNDLLKSTTNYWRSWSRKGRYVGEWKEEVIRSALVLKLLTYTPTGGIAAAATTSLPESVGHGRNWDYRFSWIRDSTYALWSFHLLGHAEEERKYFQWMLRVLKGRSSKPEALRVMYSVEGEPVPPETEVYGFSGYRNSRPVREGNSATEQSQMDIYGSIIDAIHFTFHPPEKLPDQMWRVVDGLATYVKDNWEKPDSGIWEMRNGNQRHTHSAVMSWLALWRASEMAGWIGSKRRQVDWARTAKKIHSEVMKKGYNEDLGSFTSILGGGYLDASVLMMPLVRFINANNNKFKSTMRVIEQNLMQDSFIYRYLMDDALEGKEGAFLACSFWHIIALILQGDTSRASALFKNAVKHANHLGLMSEELDPKSGEFLGNFPQAFSHMGMINAAWHLNAHNRRLFH